MHSSVSCRIYLFSKKAGTACALSGRAFLLFFLCGRYLSDAQAGDPKAQHALGVVYYRANDFGEVCQLGIALCILVL